MIPCIFDQLNCWQRICFSFQQSFPFLTKEQTMDRINPIAALDKGPDFDLFDSITEEEVIGLWRSIKGRGLSGDEAWQAVVTGIALDMAFAKSRAFMHTDH